MTYPLPPKPFLTAVVHNLPSSPQLTSLCAGFESGKWRAEALAAHVVEWLPEFALSETELRDFSPGTAVRMLRKAARLVYQTEKYRSRGEFGEILLHIVLRQVYGSIPAISKIFYKDSVNSTVKGFDAVHVVPRNNQLELWLGEVKFYTDIKKAIADAIAELKDHTTSDYLKNEFILITNKLDKQSAHYALLNELLDPNTSLDEVFSKACIPVLLTYDSTVVGSHKLSDAAYLKNIEPHRESRRLVGVSQAIISDSASWR